MKGLSPQQVPRDSQQNTHINSSWVLPNGCWFLPIFLHYINSQELQIKAENYLLFNAQINYYNLPTNPITLQQQQQQQSI